MQRDTLCLSCEWACGKDKKCPWSNKFEPVPGWQAKPTKVQIRTEPLQYTDSFFVYQCPLYEMDSELKRRIVKNAGKVRNPKNKKKEKIALVKKMYFDEKKTPRKIADELGYSVSNIYKIIRER